MSRNGFSGLVAESLARFGTFRLQARGNSMRPLIPDGSFVTLVSVQRDVRPGDVIALDLGSRLVIHRVLVVQNGWVQTVGDGNIKLDPARPVSDIIGLVSRVQLSNGWLQRTDTTLARWLGRLIVFGQRRRFSIV